ncbi:MAG: hypothetical protein AB1656_20910 [Candidatus Omnitrophota bacterium]
MMETNLFSPLRTPSSNNRGTVLIIVMWIALGLVSVALLFGNSMMLEYRAAVASEAGLEADQAVESACRYVIYILKNLEEPGTVPSVEDYTPEGAYVGDACFWLIGRSDVEDNSKQPVFGLVDECSKLNLNTATREMLEALPNMTAELAASIIDWRDEDEEASPDGAESEAYLLRSPKYYCKNGNFETVDELNLVINADWTLLYGEDANRNGVLDSNEDDGNASFPDDNRDGRLDMGILEYLTVYSRESNKRSDGTARINVTENNNQELDTLFQETFGEDRARQITQAASGNTVASVLEYYIRSQMTADEFAQVDDDLTASSDDPIEGLVNVNTASEAVLACLPGIGTENASKMAAYRQGKTDELESLAWVAEAIDDESAIQAGPYITTKSYQFTADAAAVGRNGKGFRRTAFVIDASGDSPIVVYRRDSSRLGWPLGAELRREIISGAKGKGIS